MQSKALFLCLNCLLALSIGGNAQTLVNKSWEDTTGHPTNTSYFQTAKIDASGNIYVAGSTYHQGESANVLITKYSSGGSKLWQLEFNTTSDHADIVTDLYIKGNSYYITGTAWDSANFRSRLFVCRGNATTGDTVWARTYLGAYSGYTAGASILPDNNGNIFVGGSEQQSSINFRMLIMKYDSTGTQLWTSSYDSAGYYDAGVALALNSSKNAVILTGFSGSGFANWDFVTAPFNQTTGVWSVGATVRSSNGNGAFSQPIGIGKDYNDNTFVVGTAAVSGTNTEIKLIKYDTAFNEIWVRKWGSSDSLKDEAISFAQDNYANLLVTGFTTNSAGVKKMLVLKYNTAGTLLWKQTVSAPNPARNCVGKDITADDSLNVYVTGSVNNGTDNDMMSLCYDKNGQVKWSKTYASEDTANDEGYDIMVDSDKNIIVSGRSFRPTNPRFVTMKYEPKAFVSTIHLNADTIPLYTRKQLIMRFDTSVILRSAVDNIDVIYGQTNVFLKSWFVDSIKLKVPAIRFERCYMTKLAPNFRTTDTVLIGTTGNIVRIPPVWSSFLLHYIQGDSSEAYYADTLERASSKILWAHRNYSFQMFSCEDSIGCAYATPNDTFYCNSQYALHDNAFGDYANVHINAESAWEYETGKPFVRVGVFDTPADWTHEDFKTNATTSKIVGGYDYRYHNAPLYTLGDTADFHGHGTRMSGSIGALRNNGKGIAGVAGGNWCGTPDTSNIGVSLFSFGVGAPGADGVVDISTDAIISGLNDALTGNGAINYSYMAAMNFSIASYGEPNFEELKEKFYLGFQVGKIMVAARGKLGTHGNEILYPACFNDDWVISVGGSSTAGHRHGESMYGNDMDVIAPSPAAFNITTDRGNTYSSKSGTSYSAAYTTGLAGLLLSYMNDTSGQPNYNNLTSEDVEEIIQRTSYFDSTVYFSYPDPEVGYGRIDAGAALNMVDKSLSRLLHFHSDDTTTTKTVTKITSSSILLKLTDRITNTGILPGNYKAEVYKVQETVNHNISLLPNETIRGYWALSGLSESFPHYDSTGSGYTLNPYIKAYVTESPLPDSNYATIWGYYYKLMDSATSSVIGWFPQDTANIPLMSYTIYTRSSTPLPIHEIKDGNFSVSVYPNPANHSVHFDMKSEDPEYYTVRLHNSLGQSIRQLYAGKTDRISENYNIADLGSGIYFIRIESENRAKGIKLSVIK